MKHTINPKKSISIYQPLVQLVKYSGFLVRMEDPKFKKVLEDLKADLKILSRLSFRCRSQISMFPESVKSIHMSLVERYMFNQNRSTFNYTTEAQQGSKVVRCYRTNEEVEYATCLQALGNTAVSLKNLPIYIGINTDYWLEIDSFLVDVRNFLLFGGSSMIHFSYRLKTLTGYIDEMISGKVKLSAEILRNYAPDLLRSDISSLSMSLKNVRNPALKEKIEEYRDREENQEIREILEAILNFEEVEIEETFPEEEKPD